MQEETKPSVNRRGLLRRASTLAAGVGAAGVASTVVASPASAADGDNVLIGKNNQGTSPTRLENTNGGAALALAPSTALSGSAAVGTIYVDDASNVITSSGTGELNYLYSAVWALQPFPVPPKRILDTRTAKAGGHAKGYTLADTSGRVKAKGGTLVDLTLDFTWLLNPEVIARDLAEYVTVQGNLTVAAPVSGGWAAVYSGAFTGTSSLNYSTNQNVANFTQTPLNPDGTLNFKVQKNAVLIFDLAGFILPDPFTYLDPVYLDSLIPPAPKMAARMTRAKRALPKA
jgi:hypothetical protein